MSKKNLAVFFGGISPEHEVSVITGIQLMKHVDKDKYNVVPVYIDKAGGWWSGEELTSVESYKNQNLFQPTGFTPFSLKKNNITTLTAGTSVLPDSISEAEVNSGKIDAALLCFHGAYGEAGNVQGLLELAKVPYQGPGLTSSAIAFDKIVTRQILEAEGIGQTPYTWFTLAEWQSDKSAILNKLAPLGLPVFVKPANGGSTIGIQRAQTNQELEAAIEAVLHYDHRVIVEAEVKDCIEVNVSVLGLEGDTKASVPEQPIKQDEFLSFADKYERGGGKKSGMASATRRIPAPISSALTEKLQKLAQDIFHIFDCSGVVRIDFFVNPSTEEIFVTELNTIPGSMSFYLWEASGVSYPELIDRLVEIAEQRFAQKEKLITSFETNILQNSQE
ncbi:MAG TPA: D-alanine--D-alanine ligase family protein [Patescibacteria group bacterium]